MRRLLPILACLLTLMATGAPTAASPGGGDGPADRAGKKLRWHPKVKAAFRYAERRTGTIGFQVSARGKRWGVHESVTAQGASTIKVMLLAAYLRQAGVRDRQLNRRERRLLGPMIRRSDSVAATTVRNEVGGAAIRKLARRVKMRDFEYSALWGASRTSARDQARFMRNLRRYLPARHRRYALRLLRTIVPAQRWGIARVKPSGWRLHFKGGWGDLSGGYGGLDHQVALLTRGRHRIGVAIITQGNPTLGYGNQTLRGIAKRLLRGLDR